MVMIKSVLFEQLVWTGPGAKGINNSSLASFKAIDENVFSYIFTLRVIDFVSSSFSCRNMILLLEMIEASSQVLQIVHVLLLQITNKCVKWNWWMGKTVK